MTTKVSNADRPVEVAGPGEQGIWWRRCTLIVGGIAIVMSCGFFVISCGFTILLWKHHNHCFEKLATHHNMINPVDSIKLADIDIGSSRILRMTRWGAIRFWHE